MLCVSLESGISFCHNYLTFLSASVYHFLFTYLSWIH